MLKTKLISSLSRVFVDSNLDDFTPINKMYALKGERISFQLAHSRIWEEGEGIYDYREMFTPKFSGELAKYVTVREVKMWALSFPLS